jgi:hypothetical protein
VISDEEKEEPAPEDDLRPGLDSKEFPEEPAQGGIQPDVVMEGDTPSRYGIELVRQNHFFRFTVNYITQHGDPGRDFRADEAVIGEFRAYLVDQEFDYETAAQIELDRLHELSEREDFNESTLAALAELERLLEAEKARDFERNLEYITLGIEREMLSQAYGTEGLYEVILRRDTQAQAAIELLLEPEKYEQMIMEREPIVVARQDWEARGAEVFTSVEDSYR